MLSYLAIIVMVVGLILYLATTSPKPVECGRLMFAIGLLVSLLTWGTRLVP